MSTPTYIYKIVHSSTPPPDPLPEALPVSDLDKADGFLHLSTALQLPGTLKRFFAEDERVFILRIVYKTSKATSSGKTAEEQVCTDQKSFNGLDLLILIRCHCEAPGGVGEQDMFPHIYNGLRLGKDEIESVVEWERQTGWDETINKATAEGWFIY